MSPKTQQRQQSRCPPDKKRKENQRNINVASWNLADLKIKEASDFSMHTHGNAMGHHLLARIVPRNRHTGLWRKLCLIQCPKDAGSVACTGYCTCQYGPVDWTCAQHPRIALHRKRKSSLRGTRPTLARRFLGAIQLMWRGAHNLLVENAQGDCGPVDCIQSVWSVVP